MSEASESQLARVVGDLKTSVDKLREELVSKDVYTAQREADQNTVKDIRDDVDDIKSPLRWVSRSLVISLVLPLVSSFVLLYVTTQVLK